MSYGKKELFRSLTLTWRKRDPIWPLDNSAEVVQHRLQNEYGVETRLEPLGFQVARWINGGWAELEKVGRIFNCKTVRDA